MEKNKHILLSCILIILMLSALVSGLPSWPNQGSIRHGRNIIIDGQNVYMCWQTKSVGSYGPSFRSSSDLYRSRLVPASYRGRSYMYHMDLIRTMSHQYPSIGANVICVDLKTGRVWRSW